MILKETSVTCTGCESVRTQVTPRIKIQEEFDRYGSQARRVIGPLRFGPGDLVQTVEVMEDQDDGSLRYTCPLLLERKSPVGFKTRCSGSKTFAPCRFELEVPRRERLSLTDLWKTAPDSNILVVRKTPLS